MVESIPTGLETEPGRNPKKEVDQEFDEEGEIENSRFMGDPYDDRSFTVRTLEGAHERITSNVGKASSLIAGSAGLAGLGEEIVYDSVGSQALDAAAELSAQYPAASATAITLGVAGGVYNAANELGFLSNARTALDPAQTQSGDGEYVLVDDDWEDKELNDNDELKRVGTPVESNAELDPDLDETGYTVLSESMADDSPNYVRFPTVDR